MLPIAPRFGLNVKFHANAVDCDGKDLTQRLQVLAPLQAWGDFYQITQNRIQQVQDQKDPITLDFFTAGPAPENDLPGVSAQLSTKNNGTKQFSPFFNEPSGAFFARVLEQAEALAPQLKTLGEIEAPKIQAIQKTVACLQTVNQQIAKGDFQLLTTTQSPWYTWGQKTKTITFKVAEQTYSYEVRKYPVDKDIFGREFGRAKTISALDPKQFSPYVLHFYGVYPQEQASDTLETASSKGSEISWAYNHYFDTDRGESPEFKASVHALSKETETLRDLLKAKKAL